MFRFFSHGENGLASASGETWRVQSKFTQATLKRLGLANKAKTESLILEEVQDLITDLESKAKDGSRPVEVGFELNVAIVNSLWSLITGEKRKHNDPKIQSLLKAVNRGIQLATTSGILLFMPFLIKILPERLFGIPEMRSLMDKTFGFIKDVVSNHKKELNNNDNATEEEPKDFIDAFLLESNKPDAHASFNDFQLEVLTSELFGAGGEPTSVTLKWALLFLAKNPEILAKAQDEIAQVVGQDNLVRLEHRKSLPYVQALIMDIIRLADIHPIGVMHSNDTDIVLDGFVIPKNSFVIPNFHKVHRDLTYWEKPEVLYPEHWLDASGQFVSKHEGFLSFGTGKRRCPGHDLALLEMFLFVSNLVQKFNFKLPPELVGKDIETTTGVVVSPKPYPIIMEPRC